MIVSKDTMSHAKRLIEQHGWVQGDERAIFEEKGHCIATAMIAACEKERFDLRHVFVMALLFKDANGIDRLVPLGDWNDAPERTEAEVLAAFDKAIEVSAKGMGRNE